MSKRSSAQYSLWPEQARPRRRWSLSLAVSGFALGIVCTVGAVGVFSDFTAPAAAPPPKAASVDAKPFPVYSADSLPKRSESPPVLARDDTAADSTANFRPRVTPAVRTTLPTIGRIETTPTETTGLGNTRSLDKKASASAAPPLPNPMPVAARATDAAKDGSAAANDGGPKGPDELKTGDETKSRGEIEVAAQTPAADAKLDTAAKPAAAASESSKRAVRRAKRTVHRSKPARPRREEPRGYATAPRYQTGPVYGYYGAPTYGRYPY